MHAVDTPTIRVLRASRSERAARQYVFRLTDVQVDVARKMELPDSCLVALAAITAAAYGERSGHWVTLPARTLDCMRRDFRWWHRATTKLEGAGLIQCERHVGRLPRYRLATQGTRPLSNR
jgi:hypothetical protein